MQLFLCLFIAAASPAATYNFYFNNTEQGANSIASPSTLVKEGQQNSTHATKADPLTTDPSAPGSTANAPSTSASMESGADSSPGSSLAGAPKRADWRVYGGVAWVDYDEFAPDLRKGGGWIVGAAYNFLPFLGFSAQWGRTSAVGMEFHPFTQRKGDGQLNVFCSVGIMRTKDNSRALSTYAGAGVGYGFLRGLGMIAQARYGFANHNGRDIGGELALAYLF